MSLYIVSDKSYIIFFFQAEDGIRDSSVTGVQTCALPISEWIGEVDLEIRPGEGEAYIWNCVTLPAHRRQGVFGAMVAGIAPGARTEALSRFWLGGVALPAEKGLPRARFAPVPHFSTAVLSG